MTAYAGVTREYQTSLHSSRIVKIMIMIENVKRVETSEIRLISLLPVDPPKIDPVFLIRMMQN